MGIARHSVPRTDIFKPKRKRSREVSPINAAYNPIKTTGDRNDLGGICQNVFGVKVKEVKKVSANAKKLKKASKGMRSMMSFFGGGAKKKQKTKKGGIKSFFGKRQVRLI